MGPSIWKFLFVSSFWGLCVGVTSELVNYCPLVACTGHSAAAVTMMIVFVLWLDAYETFCSTSLCVHLPLRHLSPSQRQDLQTPLRFETGELGRFGGLMSGDQYGFTQQLSWHCKICLCSVWICGWLSGPCISVQSHHAQYLAAKQQHDCLHVSVIYQTTMLRFTLLF